MKKTDLEINIEPWVMIKFSWHPEGKYNDRHDEYTIDMPRHMLERWKWLITWRHAKLICANPRVTHDIHWCYYDKKSGLDLGFDSILSKISGCRAQITKWTNNMRKYESDRKKELFFDLENDPLYQKALVKLNKQKDKLKELLIELDKMTPNGQSGI